MIGSSAMLYGSVEEHCFSKLQQQQDQVDNLFNLYKGSKRSSSFPSNNCLKRKLDSMEEDQKTCCDELVDEEACCCCSTRKNYTSRSSTLAQFEENDLFREVKRVKTSLTLSHLQLSTSSSSSSLVDSMEQDEDVVKENVQSKIIPCYSILKTPKSPPKSNTEKSLSNIMIKEIWRRKLQSSLMSQSTGVSQLPRTEINLHNEYDFDEPEERAVMPNSIPREELMRRLKTRIDSASNGRQHRFDDPHSTGISDEFDMADD